MLTIAKQEEILTKIALALEKNLQKFNSGGVVEELHQFRVKTKRINALFALVNACNPDSDLIIESKHLARLFKEAGKIRTADLNISLMNKYGFTDEALQREQYELLDRLVLIFKLDLDTKIRKLRKSLRKIRTKLFDIKNDAVVAFCNDLISSEIQFFSGTYHNSGLHENRKKIRHLLTALKLLNKRRTDQLRVNVEYLYNLQLQIGEWHDLLMFATNFNGAGIENELLLQNLNVQVNSKMSGINDMVLDFENKLFLP